MGPHHLSSNRSEALGRAPSPFSSEHHHQPAFPSLCPCSSPLSFVRLAKVRPFPGKNRLGGTRRALLSSLWYSPETKGAPGGRYPPVPARDTRDKASIFPTPDGSTFAQAFWRPVCLRLTNALEFFLLLDPKIPHVGLYPKKIVINA